MTQTSHHPFPLLRLSAMGFAAFVYVTFEMFCVGLITPMAADLGVTEGRIGLLTTAYAAVVAVVTIPLVAWTRTWDRRPVFMATLFFLAAGIVLQATAVNYAMLAVARMIAALTHGLFWSVINPMAARLVPAGQMGRAIAVVSMGSTMALVLGSPAVTFIGGFAGWRVSTWVLGAAVLVSVGLLAATLPPMPAAEPADSRDPGTARAAMASLVLFLLLAVTAAFATYTYLGLIIEVTSGRGLVAAGLVLYGLFGIVGVLVAGRRVDARMLRLNAFPQAMMVVTAAVGLAALTATGSAALALTILLVAIFGVGEGALPTVATTIFLFAGRANQDRASAIYVVTFQVGIAAGSALGALAVDAGYLWGTLLVTAVFAAAAGTTLTAWTRPLLR